VHYWEASLSLTYPHITDLKGEVCPHLYTIDWSYF